MNKTLVACFSATGNTLAVAKVAAGLTQADLFSIEPVTPYTEADLNWNDPKSRSSLEMKDPACRPAIKDKVKDMDAYQTILLGFPIWWYDAPRIILTFLDGYDFKGKIMLPFVTSGSSGLGKIPENLERACPSAQWQKGIRFAQHPDAQIIEKWITEHHGWKS